MSRKKLLIGVVVLLVASLVLGGVAACCPPAEEPTPTPTPTPTATPEGTPTATPTAGEAPTLAVGDTWTWSVVYEGDTNTRTETVSEVGADSYTVDVTFDAGLQRTAFGLDVAIGSMELSVSKDTLDPVEQLAEITAPIATTATYTYEFDYPGARWPLAVGSEWSYTLTTETALGTDTFDRTVAVEGEEDVTVAAGTFSCFKIVTSEGGEVDKTEWFSEDVKNNVKVVDASTYEAEETLELEP